MLLLAADAVCHSLIWIAGQVFLGDYLRRPHWQPQWRSAGAAGRLPRRSRSRSPGHWLVLLGPYLLLLALRGGRVLLKM